MKYFSLSLVVTLIIIGYVINTIWSLIEIFIPPKCNPQDKCFQSYLGAKPVQNLILFSSVLRHPSNQHANKIHAIRNFNYSSSSTFKVKLDLPRKTRNNGTLFLHVALVDSNHLHSDFQELQRSQSIETIPMVIYTEPRAATFNLLNNQDDGDNKSKLKNTIKTTAHINRDVTFSIFTDDIKLPANKIPGELYPYMRFTNGKYQPIIQHNILKTRLKDLEEITKDTTEIVVSVHYAPVSFGLLRLTLHMKIAIQSLQKLGFSEKDADDVKGIFADTNLYLLSATIFIASFHLLFDFLAFKNDVSFWRGKKSMAGLSIRTVLWRAFSQSVILLYLFDEKTSMIVLIPAVIGAIIELWKAKKVLRVGIEWSRVSSLPRLVFRADNNSAEQRTRAVDAEAMRYLCYLLYPLCIAGAIYSLLYEPHKSWYSWSLHSLVNGVYAFGFLFMLPQLFVNYKLKSVAALPWRAFMYKAFNTFIDDIFAFIITMPTAHRVACFRDDIVFLIYLYQRWLYPVDISRLDDSVSISENVGAVNDAVDEKKTQ